MESLTNKQTHFDANSITKYWRDQSPHTNQSEKFTDPNFPPNDDSILSGKVGTRVEGSNGRAAIDVSAIKWKRLEEIGSDYEIFLDKIEYDDIKQQSLGHCYFICVLGALAEKPDMLTKIFRTKNKNANGYFEVVLFIDGEWQVVILDDYFVVHSKKGYSSDFVFSVPNGKEIWVQILEKAWAKVNGGYTNIISGMPKDAFLALTGFNSDYINYRSDDLNKDKLWNTLLQADQSNSFMSLSSDAKAPDCDKMGIVGGHAYSLISLQEADIHGEILRLVKIRNPWGSSEWQGDYSDGDTANWTQEKKNIFGYGKHEDDGIFYMKFDDHVKYFRSAYVCNVIENAVTTCFHVPKEEVDIPQVFNLKINKMIILNISCLSWYYRYNREFDLEKTNRPTSIVIAKYDNNLCLSELTGKNCCEDDVTLSYKFTEGNYVIWIYCNYDTSSEPKHSFYNIVCSSADSYQMKKVQNDSDFSLISHIIGSHVLKDKKDKIEEYKKKGWIYTDSANQLNETGIGYIITVNPKLDKLSSLNYETSRMQGLSLLPPYKNNKSGNLVCESYELILSMKISQYGTKWMMVDVVDKKLIANDGHIKKKDIADYFTFDNFNNYVKNVKETKVVVNDDDDEDEDKKKSKKKKVVKIAEVTTPVAKFDKLLQPILNLILTDKGRLVLNNSKIVLLHINTKRGLHSHSCNYKNSSLQEITCFQDRDDNDHFNIMNISDPSHKYIKFNDSVNLVHVGTKNALFVDKSLKSPVTSQSHVSARPLNDSEGFKWVVQVIYSPYFGKKLRTGTIIKLVSSNLSLHSQNLNLKGGSKQQEVTGFSGKDEGDYWTVINIC